MENILKQGDGLRQDLLIYGKTYHLWRNNKYIGIGTYIDDPNIGDSFLNKKINSTGEECFEVFIPNEWKFV